jgi:hypothetical protein
MTPYRLGFRQKPDERDDRFPLSELMGASVSHPISKAWRPGRTLDQGRTSSCVGHACWQLQASEPLVLDPPPLSPFDIYGEARKIDEWTDNDDRDEGTSVRAGLNVLKRAGIITSYYWAQSADQCLEYLLKFGPLVFGTDWTQGMMEPDAQSVIRPTGRSHGGHAWFAYAGQWEAGWITGLTSWGDSFGSRGSFKVSRYDIDELFKRGGCAAAVVEA